MPGVLFASADGATVGVGENEISNLDLAIVIFYLVGIVALGCWAGLRKRAQAKGSDYFLAGKSLRWPMIGLALFATNISTLHLVSLAESGYCSGLLYGNFEWMAGFTLVLLSLFFAPFYIRAGVATLPDFLEKRYNRPCRDWLAVLSIFSAVVVHIGFSLYTGAVVLEESLLVAFVDNPERYRVYTIIAICSATALYTIIGGLMAVVLTESIQTVVLLVGAICITLLGLYKMGDWNGTMAGLMQVGQMTDGWGQLKETVHPVNFSMCRPDADPTGLSWYAVFLGYWITGIWYWCTDQTIVQRVLGAKNENHARIGPLFASFIKILPVFIFVLPGLICLGLIHKELIPELPRNASGAIEAGKTYPHMIRHVLPIGAQGIVIAALLAALMSTVSGALNSIATLFSYDIYKRWRPDADDRRLITVGRFATFAAMIVAIVWSLVIGQLGKTIFQAMVDLFCALAPPTAVVFFWGVFWRRASAKAAFITLVVGSIVGAVVSALTIKGMNFIGDLEINSLLSCFLLAVAESILLIVLSYVYPQRHTAESEALVWKSPLDALRGESGRGWMNYRVWTAAVLIAMIGLYVYWRGDTAYYSVGGTVSAADGTPVVGALVTFDCDDDRFDFTDVTAYDGTYRYGTKKKAGGAPEGTRYRIKVALGSDHVVRMEKDEDTDEMKVAETLYTVPAGTDVRMRTAKDGGTEVVFDVPNRKGELETVTLKIPKGQGPVEVRPASAVPEPFGRFESSGLTHTVEAMPIFTTKRKRCDLQL